MLCFLFEQPREIRSESSVVFACSLCVSNSQSRGVDVIFQTSDQRVYVLGARKFFPNKHSLIRLGWADLSTD